MNISATYSIPSGIINPTIPGSTTAFPEKSDHNEKWLPVPLETSVGGKNAYNYYVVEENREMIYTDKKMTEKIYDNSGALIDIYA